MSAEETNRMTISEPMTFATDLLLAAVGAVLARRLAVQAGRRGLTARRWWSVAFAATALAALAGGVWHGVHTHLPWLADRGLWKLTLVAAGAASFSLLAAASFGGLAPPARKTALTIATAGSLAYLFWISISDDFIAVVLTSGFALLYVAAVHFARIGRPGSKAILVGVAVALVGGVVQAARLAPHPSFNHNDLYHVIEAVALVVFFRGARRVEDLP